MPNRMERARIAALVVGLFAYASTARAGDDVPTIGNEAAISGGAVVAAGRSAAMAWFNPAGLGANQRTRLEASAQMFALQLRKIPGGLRTDLPGDSRSSAIVTREVMVVPSATVFARRIGKNVSAALALFVPSYDELDLDVRGDGFTGTVRYAHQIKVTRHQRRYHVGPAFGWEITPEVRIGVSGFIVYEREVQTTSAWARASSSEFPPATERFVHADLHESARSWGTEFVFGVQWQPVEYLHLGLAVRTPRAWFLQRIDRSAVVTEGGHNPEQGGFADLSAQPELDTAAGRPDDPMSITAAVAYSWTSRGREGGWASLEGELRPPRYSEDGDSRRMVLNIRAGARARVGRRFLLGGGFYVSRSALALADDFLEYDVDTYGFTFGGEYRRPVRLGKREAARRLVFITAVAARYGLSLGRVGRVRIDLTDLEASDREVLVTTGDPVETVTHDLALHVGTGLEF
jgi:hypothetical protein